MGRHSLARIAHPCRKCSECTYCGKKAEVELKSFFHIVNWEENDKDTLLKDFGLGYDCCLCDRCRIQIRRAMKGHVKKSRKKQRPLCFLSRYQLCEEDSCRETQEEWSQVVATFNLQEATQTEVPSTISLCRGHYRKLIDSRKERCSKCQHLIRGMKRKCPKPDVINEFNKEIGIHSSLTDKSVVCSVCYNQCRREIFRHQKLKTASMNQDLKEIVTSYKEIAETTKDEDLETYASAKAVVFAGQQFLNNRAVLLKEIQKKYQQYWQETESECRTQELGPNLKSNQSMMLDLTIAYGHHLICVTSRIKLHGTMVMWKGSDVTSMLHTVLYEQLTNKTAEATSTSSVPEKIVPRSTSSNQILSKAAQRMNSELRRQSKKFAYKAGIGQDLTVFNASSCIAEIHPVVWNFFYLLTETTTEQRKRDRLQDFTWDTRYCKSGPSDHIQASDFRRLFNICHALFLMNDKSSYPIHLFLADTVQCQGGTVFLLQLLNRLGIASSRTTLDAHKNAAIRTELPTTRRKRGTSAAAFASVDNVDKESPYAVVTADAKPGSVHRTSYQVFPQPTQDVNVGDDHVSCSTPQSPQDCGTLKAIKLPHDCQNLYKVLACRNDPTLRHCQRDSNGVPTSTCNKELETVLSQYYKAELVNIISDNKLDAFMDEVGELLLMECQDMTARLELLKKESTTPAEVEASAVAFAAKCPVQIFRLGSEGRFLYRYKEFGTCFLGVEPLQLLQDATGFDILLSNKLASSTTNLTGDSQRPNFEVFQAWRDQNASLLGNEKVALPISVALHAGQVEDNTSTLSTQTTEDSSFRYRLS